MTRSSKSDKINKSIIEILSILETPLTAEDIYIEVIQKEIKTSISSIYAYLHRLVQNQILYVDNELRACRYYYK